MRIYSDLEIQFIDHICTDYNILAFIMKKLQLNDFGFYEKKRLDTINYLFAFTTETNKERWERVFSTTEYEFKEAYIEMRRKNLERYVRSTTEKATP